MAEKKEKYEVVFEENDHTTIWKYDLRVTTNGPISVEIKYKKNYSHTPVKKKKSLIDHIK
jgi:hypothetical protein